MMKKLTFFIILLPILLCKKKEEKVKLSILGLNLQNNVYYFEGKIDKNVTPYCGEVTKSKTTEKTEDTLYDIDSFYRFEFGDYMQLRYTYDSQRKMYSLTPSATNISTCQTNDFINCVSGGRAICETADGLKCGGTKTFIFVGVLNPVVFQAVSGTIDWSKGLYLTGDERYVQKVNLEFRMVDKNGNILEGKVFCNTKF